MLKTLRQSVFLIFMSFLFSLDSTASQLQILSSRHYPGDEDIYKAFEQETNIQIDLIEATSKHILDQLAKDNIPIADLFMNVDLDLQYQLQLQKKLDKIDISNLYEAIPDYLHHSQKLWYPVSYRMRIITARRDHDLPAIQRYEDLAQPDLKWQLCLRSCQSPYNQNLIASWLSHGDEAKVISQLQNYQNNLAQTPRGGDTAQLRNLLKNVCPVTITNHYYYLRFQNRLQKKKLENILHPIIPNQASDDTGAHISATLISLFKNAPNRENALRFIRFMTQKSIQAQFAAKNYEYPARKDVLQAPELNIFGQVKTDKTPLEKMMPLLSKAHSFCTTYGWDDA